MGHCWSLWVIVGHEGSSGCHQVSSGVIRCQGVKVSSVALTLVVLARIGSRDALRARPLAVEAAAVKAAVKAAAAVEQATPLAAPIALHPKRRLEILIWSLADCMLIAC